MFLDYFSFEQGLYILSGLIFLLISLLFFETEKKKWGSNSFLFLGSFFMALFFAHLDNYLNLWDEQVHMLVAKNMMHEPFMPLFYADPALAYDPGNWLGNKIWLHKQPLFLWQMALSMKIFGPTILAGRLPGVLMHALTSLLIFRLGSLLGQRRSGLYAALIFSLLYFPLELVSGRMSTDHNDTAFLFYICCTYWSFFENHRTRKKIWLVGLGIFAGAAVLNKWLMGLLVFVLWFLSMLISKPKGIFSLRSKGWVALWPMPLSFGIALLVLMPWQIFISQAYPEEAQIELSQNGKHFFEVIEGHAEDPYYFLGEGLETVYGDWPNGGGKNSYIFLAGILLFGWQIRDRFKKVFYWISIPFVYLFFSLASTKMPAFVLIVSPFVLLGLGAILTLFHNQTLGRIPIRVIKVILAPIIPFIIAFHFLDYRGILDNHTEKNSYIARWMAIEEYERNFFTTISKDYPEDAIIFNTSLSEYGHIPAMFFTPYTAYNFIPNDDQLQTALETGRKVVILDKGDLDDEWMEIHNIEIVETKGWQALNATFN